jgi:alpha-ketoglutarate-dependent taurine dioxygenase
MTATTVVSAASLLWPPFSSLIFPHSRSQQQLLLQRVQRHLLPLFSPQHRCCRRHHHHWPFSSKSPTTRSHPIIRQISSSSPSPSLSVVAELVHHNYNNNDDFHRMSLNGDDQFYQTLRLLKSALHHQTTVSTSEDGQTVSINMMSLSNTGNGTTTTSTTTTTLTLFAPLLWVNDPLHIHPSSGQRLRSLGQGSRDDFAIGNAEIVAVVPSNPTICITTTISTDEEDKNSTILHSQPLLGSMHPRGGIYHTRRSTECETHNNLELERRHMLKVKRRSGQESWYDLNWLIDHCREGRIGRMAVSSSTASSDDLVEESIETTTMDSATMGPPSLTRVTKDIAIGAFGNSNVRSIPIFDYTRVMENKNDTTTLLHAMQGIYEHGAILIQGAPPTDSVDESIVENLGKLLSGGRLSHGSLYGDVFHVETKVDAENIAYTNVPLPPHQDLTYFESKPFLQLLHCVNYEGRDGTNNDRIIGGESVLIDAMAAAEELRLIAPDIFKVLCQYEATFLKERDGADMVSPKPHIVTDPSFGEVVEINWSPPFEGPLQLNPHIPLEDYIRAYQAMECLLDDQLVQSSRPKADRPTTTTSSLLPLELEQILREYAKTYTWEYALNHGDILVFNNQRMLHGRRGFTMVGNSRRHLIGCYTDAMETTSCYRQLLRERRNVETSINNQNNIDNNISGVDVAGVTVVGRLRGRRNVGNGVRWM